MAFQPSLDGLPRPAKQAADLDRFRQAGLLGKPPLFIAVEGEAQLIRDKAAFEAHWHKELDYWFEQGIDTPGIVLIKVHARRIHYWSGKDEGEVKV